MSCHSLRHPPITSLPAQGPSPLPWTCPDGQLPQMNCKSGGPHRSIRGTDRTEVHTQPLLLDLGGVPRHSLALAGSLSCESRAVAGLQRPGQVMGSAGASWVHILEKKKK